MVLRFEWDGRKADTNLRNHGVSFEEATTAFGDPLSITIPDHYHSRSEERYILLGQLSGGMLLVVAHVERGETLRIISARKATSRERRYYEEE